MLRLSAFTLDGDTIQYHDTGRYRSILIGIDRDVEALINTVGPAGA